MLAQQYYLFPGIQKLKKHVISQNMADHITASTIKLLVFTINGL